MQIAVPLDGTAQSNVTAVLLSGRGSGAPSGRLAHGTRAPRYRLSLIEPSHQAASSGRSEKYSAFVPGGNQRRKGWQNWRVCLSTGAILKRNGSSSKLTRPRDYSRLVRSRT